MCFFVASGRRHTRRPRDWSSEVCSSDLKSRHIQELIAMTGGSLVKNVQVFDVYTGDDLPAQMKSIAYRIYFQDEAKTLKDQEVDELYDKIVKQVNETFLAYVRSS